MKRWLTKKRVLAAAGLFGVVGIWFVVSTVWLRPWFPELLYARAVARLTIGSPTTLSELGVLDGIGLDFYSDDLDDLSIEHRREENRKIAAELELLRTYDRDRVPDPVTHDVIEWFLDDLVRGQQFALHNYPVNQLFGVQTRLADVMLTIHPLRTEGNAEDYLARISKFPAAFEQLLDGLRQREAIGVVPPDFILRRVIEDLEAFIEPPPADHVLFTHFSDRTAEIEGLDPVRRDELLTELEASIDASVYPAYQILLAFLKRQLDLASDEPGVWKLPDGASYYAYRLRHHTTSDLVPSELHRLGLREVEALRADIHETLRAEGYQVDDLRTVMADLASEPRFQLEDSEAGRKQAIQRYEELIDEATRDLEPLFSLRPTTGLEVVPIPPHREAGAPQAYYEPGGLDGTRPGRFFVNLRTLGETPSFGMRTLAHHEGVPGHHFQIGVHLLPDRLPLVRKVLPFVMPFDAYLEGWAHYAERLAAEQGLLDDPYERIGYLQGELLRAARLVVDTGLHAQRWSRDRAVQYLTANTGMAATDVEAEVDRYVVFPGQACAYKVGQLSMLRLRERARNRLGDRFDITAFHDVVLGNGVVPLAVLERIIESWIEEVGQG